MTSNLDLELKTRVADLSKAWSSHDADSILQNFFSPRAWISGEGMPSAARDEAAVRATLAHMFEQAPNVTVEAVSVHELGSGVASWLHWHITTKAGDVQATMRSLTLWERIEGRLVIMADSFSVGVL